MIELLNIATLPDVQGIAGSSVVMIAAIVVAALFASVMVKMF